MLSLRKSRRRPQADKTASASGQELLVITNIGMDEPTRGDNRGLEGTGAGVARALGARNLYLDFEAVRARTGCTKKRDSYIRGLRQIFAENGRPAIVIGGRNNSGQSNDLIKAALKDLPGETFYIEGNTPKLSGHYNGDDEILPHHLTPESLAAEGKKFGAAYPNLEHPLIAVMLTSDERGENIEKMASIFSQYPEATVFLCGCKRTGRGFMDDFTKTLKRGIRGRGAADRINVLTYHFDDGTENPYIGLLNEADHVIISGKSGSMTCEALATGKSVFITDGDHECDFSKKGFAAYRESGHVKLLEDCDPHAELATDKVKPVNATARIISGIVDDYRRYRQGEKILQRNYNPDTEYSWRQYHPVSIV